jgi:hypothetical protein
MGRVKAAKVIQYKYVEKYSQDNSCVPSLPISKKDEKKYVVYGQLQLLGMSSTIIGYQKN